MTDNATYRPKTILKKYDLRFKDGKMFFVPVEDEQPKSSEKNMEQEKPHQPNKYTLPPRVLEKALAEIPAEARLRFLELLKTRLANLQIDPSAASGEKPLTEEDEDKVIKSIKKALITTYAERRKLNATMMEQYANLTADPPDKIPVEVTAALNHLLEEQDLVAYIARALSRIGGYTVLTAQSSAQASSGLRYPTTQWSPLKASTMASRKSSGSSTVKEKIQRKCRYWADQYLADPIVKTSHEHSSFYKDPDSLARVEHNLKRALGDLYLWRALLESPPSPK